MRLEGRKLLDGHTKNNFASRSLKGNAYLDPIDDCFRKIEHGPTSVASLVHLFIASVVGLVKFGFLCIILPQFVTVIVLIQ